jgi:hypothetical protein
MGSYSILKNNSVYLISIIIVLLLSGCGRFRHQTPEEQIEAFLERAEFRVEARDVAATTALISYDYADLWGRDREQMRRLLTGYFLRHRTIHVLKKIDRITVANERSAQVVLYAALAASVEEHSESPSFRDWHGDLIQLEADLVLESDGQWRVLRLNWRQVQKEDLLPSS